ncbi:hypothetical protein Zmor_001527 [Zophobas morio]|uniref:Tf2-1-like SH3-like domain-containing protein n=1 Tax=Zophobas morio TaxID=2755281 RepID=A0AA38J7J8_9CUCU|nr:hypothetical protein Zmor_001527 [Zophobas morio]
MISGHEGTKTLLGADFIEDARLVLDLAGRSYHVKGEPQREFPFVEQAVYDTKVPTDAKVQTALASMRPPDPLDSLEGSPNPRKMAPEIMDVDDDDDCFGPPPPIAKKSPQGRWHVYQAPYATEYMMHDACLAWDAVSTEQNYLFPEKPRRTTRVHLFSVHLRANEAQSLSEGQRGNLSQILEEYEDVFRDQGPPTPYMEHGIPTGEHTAISQPPYRLTPAKKVQLKAEIDGMLEADIIGECDSPWASPVVMKANPIERKNRDMKTLLAIQIGKNPHTQWPDKLPAIRFAMNTAICSSTGFNSAYLMFGREPRTIGDVTQDLRGLIVVETFIEEITPRLLRFADDLSQARETHEKGQLRQKCQADKGRRPAPEYNPGDLVLVTTHILSKTRAGISSKFAPRRDGPYRVLQARGPTSYEIVEDADPSQLLGTYYSSQLRPYLSTTQEGAPPAPIMPIRKRGRPRKNPAVQNQ